MLRIIHRKITLLLIILLFSSVACKPKIQRGDAVWLRSRADAGMFAVLGDVLTVLECYETGFCSAAKIDFGTEGLYYDARKGPNWFTYYFEPLNLGPVPPGGHYFESHEPSQNGLRWLERDGSREELYHLIHKYLRIKPDIQAEIDRFANTHFKGKKFVIGIHYRGTDKGSEAPLVKYEKALEQVQQQAKLRKIENYDVFVATDEQEFINFMRGHYGNRLSYVTEAHRSKDGQPVHMDKTINQYQHGREALIDCVLLSRTNLLIRTSSNLSLFSTYFNPKLDVVELSKRY